MPELPEVDHARAVLTRFLDGRRLRSARAERGRPVEGAPASLARAARGATCRSARRRGKHLLLPLTGNGRTPGLHLHLGMTGRVVVLPPRARRPVHGRLWLVREDGVQVGLSDPRRFGRVRLVPTHRLDDLSEVAALGPDPVLDQWDGDVLGACLEGTRRPVKEALLDQSRVAGLGNIYVAEALHAARISPFRKAHRLRADERPVLAAAIRDVLRASLTAFARLRRRQVRAHDRGDRSAFDGPLYLTDGAEESHGFRVYGHEGAPCVRCAAPLRRDPQGGRSTYWCSSCQR